MKYLEYIMRSIQAMVLGTIITDIFRVMPSL
jgi:hypothetical protein